MSLISDQPWYWWLLCVVAGLAYSAVMYWWPRRTDTDKWVRWTASALRFVVVTLLAFLFLSPLTKRVVNEKEKPVVLLLQDNSKSVVLSTDSTYYRTDYAKAVERLTSKLASHYTVESYTYDATLSPSATTDYSGNATDMSQALMAVADRYAGRNVGAVILTGDGIFNQGSDPVSSAHSLSWPLYTVALGDTMPRRDALVAHVRYNRVAYLGNSFPLEITVKALQMAGNKATLTISNGGRRLYTKQLEYAGNNFVSVENVTIDADKAGLQSYVVSLTVGDGETSVRNNSRTLPIEVIDGRQRVAIVAAAPHPDVSALRRSIESNAGYEVSTFLAADFKEPPSKYNLIVLHNLPGKQVPLPAALEPAKSGVPTLFVIGRGTDLPRFNALHTGLEVFTKIDQYNEVTPVWERNFTLFTVDEELGRKAEAFPPLSAPFGEYHLAANMQAAFTCRVGTVGSGDPLMAFGQQQELRYAFVVGEGLWRWMLADYQNSNSHDNFNQLINKMVVYTSLRINKDRFHVTSQGVYTADEPVQFEAELYNDSYEPVNVPEVSLEIKQTGSQQPGNQQEKLTFLFNKSGNGYALNAGIMPPGTYHYTATTSFNGKRLAAGGTFVVEDQMLEELDLRADHATLRTLATQSGAEMVSARDIEQLASLIEKRDDIKTVIYSRTRYSELLNLPLIFILITLLLGAEWVLRKYHGIL